MITFLINEVSVILAFTATEKTQKIDSIEAIGNNIVLI